MNEIQALIMTNIDWIVIGLLLIQLFSLVLFFAASRRQRKVYKTYQKLLQGNSEVNVEELLVSYGSKVQKIEHSIQSVQNQFRSISEELNRKIDSAGVVRYNAFEQGGSDLSFSVALLNRNQDGVVLTSLYGREDSRVYAKPIKNGKSAYTLTNEEMQAIEKVES